MITILRSSNVLMWTYVLGMLGIFHAFAFSKISFFKKFFEEHYHSVKQFGFRPTEFAKFISRRQKPQLQVRIQRGGQGVRTPLENHKLYGFL